MLSQRIGLDALKFNNLLQDSDIRLARDASKSLLKHSEEMQTANKRLSSGNLSSSRFVVLSSKIRALYFGPKNLSQRVNHYTELGRRLSKLSDSDQATPLAMEIIALAPGLLSDLNDAVAVYQTEGEQNIAFSEYIAWAAISIIIILLFIEARFIFRPILRIVGESRMMEEKRIEELSEQVELRTIKLEKANLRLRELATCDQLTGLKNRTTLFDEIALLIGMYRKNQVHFALAYVDIDFFKGINDSHGHAFGDFILKEFSRIIQSNLRESDDFYRVGGEEFVILFKRGPLSGVVSKLEYLQQYVRDHLFSNDTTSAKITFSCGVFHTSKFEKFDVDEALNLADQALYASKTSGRDKITIAENHRD